MKKYGIEAPLTGFPFPDLCEVIEDDGRIEVGINNGVLSAGYDDPTLEALARDAAETWLACWNHRHRWDAKGDFTHSWEISDTGSRHWFASLSGEIQPMGSISATTERKVTIQGKARIISQQSVNTKSFSNDKGMREKAAKYPELREALRHYQSEVATNDRPLYGVYKALETLTDKFHSNQEKGRRGLAAFVGIDYDYVNDTMKTANSTRHANPKSQAVVDEKECKERAAWIIGEYAAKLH